MPKDDRNTLPEGYELEGYRLDAVLGVGGFGVTYRGTELSFNRPVAIKEYLPGNIARRKGDHVRVEAKAHSEEADYQFCLDCFRQEAETLVNFRHPNIVSVLRYFEALPVREIAEALQCSEGVVKSMLFRSIKKLRDQLTLTSEASA